METKCRMLLVMALAVVSLTASATTQTDSLHHVGMDEVVVTGSNGDMERSRLPFSVTTIGGEELEAMGQSQLLSAISLQVPGLFVSERNIFGFGVSNGGSGLMKIRGVGSERACAVLMMMDGQPQFAGIYSHHVADFYETEYVERVEVLRGSGSMLYGSNAMGGVVNVVTKNVREDGVRTTIGSQYGSYNTWCTSLSNTMRFGRFSSLVSAGYDRTDGLTDNFDFKQGSAYAKLGYDFSEAWQARADYSLMKFVGNDPIYPKLSNPESTDIYHQNVTRGAASVAVSNRYASTNGCVRVYYSHGNHHIDDPRRFHSLDNRFGIIGYQNIKPWKGASATVGFDFDTYAGEIPTSGGKDHAPGAMATIGWKRVTEYSPYVSLSQSLLGERLTLNAGLRMANSNRFATRWVPQGGFVVVPAKGWTVKGSLARGFRNPSFREMYLYKFANPDLEPEDMMNYEVTVGKRFSHLFAVDVTAYCCKGSNMIQTEGNRNENTGSFINKGVEVAAHSRPVEPVALRASYSYLHTSLANLNAAPRHMCFLGVNWQALSCLQVNAELRGVSGLYVADDMERQDYVLLNMRLLYRLNKMIELSATLNNITDTDYMINRGYEMPGFNVMGGFKLRI